VWVSEVLGCCIRSGIIIYYRCVLVELGWLVFTLTFLLAFYIIYYCYTTWSCCYVGACCLSIRYGVAYMR